MAVLGASWPEFCVESDPDVEALVFEDPPELLRPPPNPEFELAPNPPPEFPPSVDVAEPPNAELELPNAEPFEPELLKAEAEVAPARGAPPKPPPNERPGSP